MVERTVLSITLLAFLRFSATGGNMLESLHFTQGNCRFGRINRIPKKFISSKEKVRVYL